jgi:DNA invertase Pin-like site-specific DNA recombinase
MTDSDSRAFGYIRKSTNEAARQVASLEAQRAEIERYASKHGLHIVRVLEDSISGDAERREGFDEMMHRAVNGREVQHVCVWKFNRFSREEPLDCMGHYRSLFGAGVAVHSTSEGRVYKDARDIPTLVMLLMDSAQNHEFLRNLSADVSRGFVSKMEEAKRRLASLAGAGGNGSLPKVGWPIGRVPPFGFDAMYFDTAMKPYQVIRYHPEGVREVFDLNGHRTRVLPQGTPVPRSKGDSVALVPSIPERVSLIREVFESFTRKGKGPKEIAKEFNERDLRSPRGADWSMATIREMTRRPEYAGTTAFNRKCRGKYTRIVKGHGEPHDRKINPRTGRPFRHLRNPKEDWFLIEETHESLVDKTTWTLAQQVTKARTQDRKSRGTSGRGRYLLSGLIQCTLPGCGRNFIGYVQGNSRSYRCGGYQYGSGCRKAQQFAERLVTEPLRDVIVRRLEGFLDTEGDGVLAPFVERELRRGLNGHGSGRRERAERRLKEIQDQVTALVRGIAPDLMNMVNGQLRELKQEKSRLEEALAGMPGEPGPAIGSSRIRTALLETKAYLGNLRKVFDRGEIEEMRQMFRAFVHRIWIFSERQFAKIALYPTEHVLERRLVYHFGVIPPTGVEPVSLD